MLVETPAGEINLQYWWGHAPQTIIKKGKHPLWNRAGTQFLFLTENPTTNGQASQGWKLWLANADGSGAKSLSDYEIASKPSWSPDGKWIVAEVYVWRSTMNKPLRLTSVVKINVLSGQFTSLVDAPNSDKNGSGAKRPSWSPRGDLISYFWTNRGSTEGDIYIIDANGLNNQRITPDYLRPSLAAFENNMAWFPNGEYLAFLVSKNNNVLNYDGLYTYNLSDQRLSIALPNDRVTGSQVIAVNNFVYVGKTTGNVTQVSMSAKGVAIGKKSFSMPYYYDLAGSIAANQDIIVLSAGKKGSTTYPLHIFGARHDAMGMTDYGPGINPSLLSETFKARP